MVRFFNMPIIKKLFRMSNEEGRKAAEIMNIQLGLIAEKRHRSKAENMIMI
jgi:hypothetical protein